MQVITFAELEAEVRRLAAERPDYVYPAADGGENCFYQDEGKPRCIFGEALGILDVLVPQGETKAIDYLLADLGVATTAEQLGWAGQVQYYQDRGRSWGSAVRYADEDDE